MSIRRIGYYKFYSSSDKSIGFFNRTNDKFPDHGEIVNDWVPPTLELINGGHGDYLFGPGATKIISEELKELFETYDCEKSCLEFLPVNVVSKEHGDRRYYLVHFNCIHDVIDKDVTIYVPTTKSIIKVGLDYRKVKDLDILNTRPIVNDLIVSERLWSEMKKRKLTKGIAFLPICCGHTENE